MAASIDATRWVEEVQQLLENGSAEQLASVDLEEAEAEVEGALQKPKALQQMFQAASERLAQLASPGPELLEQELQMSAAAAILRLVPSKIGTLLARVFVQTGFIGSLGALMDAFSRFPGDLQAVDSSDVGRKLLALLLQSATDMCEGVFKRGQGPTISCRDSCGQELLPSLLKLAPRLSDNFSLTNKRLSTELLLVLLTKSRNNIEIVRGGSRQDFLAMYRSLLPGCGDFAVQVNLLEVLYRLARNGLTELSLEALALPEQPEAAPPVKLFRTLASKGYQGLDLAKELRKILVAYNAYLGSHATVRSVLCERIDLSLPLVRSTDQWIDIGAGRTLSMSVTIQDPEDTDAKVLPEILDIPFSELTSITLNDTGNPGSARVDLVTRAPDLLQQHSADRPLEVRISLRVGMAHDLLLALPPLDRSRLLHNASQGQAVSELWLQLSQGQEQEQEPAGSRQGTAGSGCRTQAGTQRQHKMSIGVTTYSALVLQPSRAPALHAKPPLHLTAARPSGAAGTAVLAAAGGRVATGGRAAVSDPSHSPLQKQGGRGRGQKAASEGAAAAVGVAVAQPAASGDHASQRRERPGVDDSRPGPAAAAEDMMGGDEHEGTISSPAAPSQDGPEGVQSPLVDPAVQEHAGDEGLAEVDLRASSPEESVDRQHRRDAQELLLATPESRGKEPEPEPSADTGDRTSNADLHASDEEERPQQQQQQQQQPLGVGGGDAAPAPAEQGPPSAVPVPRLSQRASAEQRAAAAGSGPPAKGKATAAAMAIAAEVMLNGNTTNRTFGGDAGSLGLRGEGAPAREAATTTSSARVPPAVAARTRAQDRQAASAGKGGDAERPLLHGAKRSSPEASAGDANGGRRAKEARVEEEEPAHEREQQGHREVLLGAGGAAGKPPLGPKITRSTPGAGLQAAPASDLGGAVEGGDGTRKLERRVSPRRSAPGGGASGGKGGTVTTARLGKARATASAAAAAPAAAAKHVVEKVTAPEPDSQPEWMLAGDEPEQRKKAPDASGPRPPTGEVGTPVSSKTFKARRELAQQKQAPGSPYDLDSEDEGPTTTGDHLASAAVRAGGRAPPADAAGPEVRQSKVAAAGSKGAGRGKEGKGKGEGVAAAGEGKRQGAATKKGAPAAAAAKPSQPAAAAPAAVKEKARQNGGGKRQQQPQQRPQGPASPDPIEDDSERQDLAAAAGVKRQRGPGPAAEGKAAGKVQKADSRSKAEPGAGLHGRAGEGAAGDRVSLRAESGGSPGKPAPAAGGLGSPDVSKQVSELQPWSEIEQEELLVEQEELLVYAPGGAGQGEGREAKRRRVEGAKEGESQHEAQLEQRAGKRAGAGQGPPAGAPRQLAGKAGAGHAAAAARAGAQAVPAAGAAGEKKKAPAAPRDVLDSAYQLKAPQAVKGRAPAAQGAAVPQALALPEVAVAAAGGSGAAVARGSRAVAGKLRGLGGEEQGSEQQGQQHVSPGDEEEGEGREEMETSLAATARELRLSSIKKPGAAGAGGSGAREQAGGVERAGRGEGAKRRARGSSDEEEEGVGEEAVAGVRAGEGSGRMPFALAPLPALERAAPGQQRAAGRSAAAAAAAAAAAPKGQASERQWGVKAAAEAQQKKRPALAPLAALGSLAAPAAPAPAPGLHKLDLAPGKAQGGRARAAGGAGTAAAASVAPLRLPSVALGRSKPGQGRGQAEGSNVMSDLVTMLLGQDEDAEGDETGDDDSKQLQALMLRIIENKKAKLKKRKEALIQDFLDRVQVGEQSLDAARAKIKQAAHESIQRQLEQFQSSLDTKQSEIQAVIQGFHAHLKVMWGEYEGEYQKMNFVREEMEGAAQSHVQQEQQAIQAYSAEVAAELAKLEEKLQAVDSKRGMPDLSFLTKGARR